MSRSTLLRLSTTVGLFALAACGDRTPITEPLATSADDLSITASALEQEAFRADGSGDADRATAFRGAAAALRFGVRPSVIEVGVDGESHRYLAVVTGNIERLADGDTALRRTLVAWRGANGPLDILRIITLGNQGAFSSEAEPATNPRARAHGLWVNLQRDSRWLATTGSTGLALGDLGGACAPLGRAENDVRCVRATFGFDVDGLFRLGGASPDDGAPAVRIRAETQRVEGVVLGAAPTTRSR